MRSRWLAAVAAVFVATAAAVSFGTPALADPDTVRAAEWFLDALRIPDAQKVSTGAGVVVAVIDTPIDSRVPDLAGQLLPGYSYVPNSSNGVATGSATLHGTNMAGLIAGKGGGDLHMLGIAPGAKILPVAVNPGEFASLGASAKDVSAAIRWAADHGAKVINLSLGAAAAPAPADVDAVRYALSKDAVVVAAAGNASESGPNVATPANVPGVVAVSGGTQSGDAWSGSGHGPEVVVAAPATNIATTAPTEYSASGFSVGDGTSQATAITSGVIALIRSKFPQLNAANVINRLIATAKDNGLPGRDPFFGYGSIRPLQALTADVAPVTANPLITATGSPTPAGQGSATGPTGIHQIPVGVVIAVVLAVPLLIITLVLVLVVARGRRRPPPGPGYPQPGYPPPGQPPPGQPTYPQNPPHLGPPAAGPSAPPPPQRWS